MKTIANIFIVLTLFAAVSCNKYEIQNIEPKQTMDVQKATRQLALNNPRGELDLSQLKTARVYFDFHSFYIQLKRVVDEPIWVEPPQKVYGAMLYVYDKKSTSMPTKDIFYAVTSALPVSDHSMMWNLVAITFNPGFPQHQFYSDMQVMIAAQGVNPSITLTPTGVVCMGRLFDVARQPVAAIPQ